MTMRCGISEHLTYEKQFWNLAQRDEFSVFARRKTISFPSILAKMGTTAEAVFGLYFDKEFVIDAIYTFAKCHQQRASERD